MTKANEKKIWWASLAFAPQPLVFAIIFVLFLVKSIGTIDPDFGWHLRSGQYIAEHGVPMYDIFTYTARDFPWIHHEWLADVVSAGVYWAGGYWLLGVLFAGLWTFAIWLVARKNPLTIVTLIAVCALLGFAGIRAVTWTVVFSAILYVLLARGGRARIAVLPLMILWANMHGGFIIGLAYMGWRVLADRSRTLAILLVSSLLLTCITPYGAGMYVEIWRTLGDTELHANIQEWNSFALTLSAAAITGIWIATRAIAVTPWWKAVISFETILLLGTVSSIRNLPLFCLFALAWLAAVLARSHMTKQSTIRTLFPIRHLIAVAMLGLLVVMGWGVYDALRGTNLVPETNRPRSIVRALKESPCDGNLFNSYNVGGYFIWRLPDTPVYIDGRMPSWEHNGQKYMRIYKEVYKDQAVQHREFDRYTIRCAVIESESDLAKRLQREGWRRELVDSGYVLLRRSAV